MAYYFSFSISKFASVTARLTP